MSEEIHNIIMNLIDYLNTYKDISFKENRFNEVDAMILSLMSYFPFDGLGKSKITSDTMIEYLQIYQSPIQSERKLSDIVVLKILCSCKRYKDIKFLDFVKKTSGEAIEQFQAVTIDLGDFCFVSFCGTDATIIGWREDFNMAFLDIVPSEVDAIQYINMQRKKHPFKKMYIGGHSKGGRLAIRAGKELEKKDNLLAIFSFDGPNFTDSFYDYSYEEMKHLIYEYAPNESIVGRLINDHPKIIVSSTAKGIMQHNCYSWEVVEDHLVHKEEYTSKSNKIAKITKEAFTGFDLETKSIFVNTLFDIIKDVDLGKVNDDVMVFAKSSLKNVKIEWKNTPKEKRKVLLKVLLTTIMIAVKR